jgi:hypothetical protein
LVASATALVDRLGDPLPTLGTFTILRTRSASYDAEIDLPATPQSIALRVLPEVETQPARYRVSLSSVAQDNTAHGRGMVWPAVARRYVQTFDRACRREPSAPRISQGFPVHARAL